MIQQLLRFFREEVVHRAGAASWRIAILMAAVLCYSSTGYMFFEIAKKPDTTWGQALWWSVVTMTTVGYGDMFPETTGGRFLVAVPTMIIGIGLLGFVLSVVATSLIEARAHQLKGTAKVRMKKHIIICNYPSRMRLLDLVEQIRSDESTANAAILLVADTLDELPLDLAKRGVQFVQGNPAKAETLRKACIQDAQGALVLAQNPQDAHSDHTTLAILLTIETTRPDVFTVAELVDNDNREHFERTGCDAIVCLSHFTTQLMVQELLDPGVQAVVDQLTSTAYGQQFYVVGMAAPESHPVRDIQEWAKRHQALFLGFQRKGSTAEVNPSPETMLEPGDRLVLISYHRPKPYTG